ncbi:MAG: hypothetical protein WCX88_03210 [Patescibacteria group bacterium]|jgi:hypothetical protein
MFTYLASHTEFLAKVKTTAMLLGIAIAMLYPVYCTYLASCVSHPVAAIASPAPAAQDNE